MSILGRINRIIKANVQWFLDKAEGPEQELDSRIHELQTAIQDGRACAATYGATYRRMQTEQDSLRQKQQDLQTQAETALTGGDEDFARASLREKIVLDERIAAMEPGIARGRQTYDQLRENLARLQDQLRDMRLRLSELRARKRAAAAQIAFDQKWTGATDSDASAMDLDRLEEDVIQAEAEADVRAEMRSGTLTDRDLEQRSRELQVDAELEALRQQLGGTSET